jgi:hypothetical protein
VGRGIAVESASSDVVIPRGIRKWLRVRVLAVPHRSGLREEVRPAMHVEDAPGVAWNPRSVGAGTGSCQRDPDAHATHCHVTARGLTTLWLAVEKATSHRVHGGPSPRRCLRRASSASRRRWCRRCYCPRAAREGRTPPELHEHAMWHRVERDLRWWSNVALHRVEALDLAAEVECRRTSARSPRRGRADEGRPARIPPRLSVPAGHVGSSRQVLVSMGDATYTMLSRAGV